MNSIFFRWCKLLLGKHGTSFYQKIFSASLLLGKEWEQILDLAGQLPIKMRQLKI